MSTEHLLWLLCAAAFLARVVLRRLDADGAVRILGWAAFLAFAAGAGVWSVRDTWAYYTGAKDDALRLSYWGSYREHEMWAEIVADFETQHPGVHVRREYITTRYEEKIQQLLLADEAPDVVLFQDEPFPRFVASGRFEGLDGYFDAGGDRLDLDRDYWDTAVQSFRLDGVTYGVPIWGGDCLVLYNRVAFRAAGVPEPDPDWTVDDFVRTCLRLTGDDDGDGRVDRYAFPLPSWVYWLPFHYAFGATYLDAARTRWTLWGPEAEASYGLYRDLRHRWHVSPQRDELTEGGSVAFMTGRAAMFVSGPWAMPTLNEAGIDYDVAHVPRGPGGRGTRVTWDSLLLFAGSTRKADAWRFIRFATSLPAQRVVARYQRSVPALVAARDAFVEANPAVHAERFIEALDYARYQPITEHWALMNREIGSEVDLMLDGHQDAPTTLARLARNEHLRARFEMPRVP